MDSIVSPQKLAITLFNGTIADLVQHIVYHNTCVTERQITTHVSKLQINNAKKTFAQERI